MFQSAIDHKVMELRDSLATNAKENNVPERILLGKDWEVAETELHVHNRSAKV